MGLMRNLSAAQIVEQLVEARRLLRETPEAGTATNIVFMGMGMPLPIAQPTTFRPRGCQRNTSTHHTAAW